MDFSNPVIMTFSDILLLPVIGIIFILIGNIIRLLIEEAKEKENNG